MPQYTNTETRRKIEALKDFHRLLLSFLHGLDRTEVNFKEKCDKLFKMSTCLEDCIKEFEKIDTTTNKFALEEECLDMTYNLIFTNSSYQNCQTYLNYATKLANSAHNKQMLGTAMKWIAGLTILLLPVIFVLAFSLYAGIAVAATAIIAAGIMGLGFLLEKHNRKKGVTPTHMARLGEARNAFFTDSLEHLGTMEDGFAPAFKTYCHENQAQLNPAEHPLDATLFNQFFAAPA